jgi:pyruvate dehydrogenase E1 component
LSISAQNVLSPSAPAGHTDADPTETREWVESLESVLHEAGVERALFLLDELAQQLRSKGVRTSVQPYSAYRNTIPLESSRRQATVRSSQLGPSG